LWGTGPDAQKKEPHEAAQVNREASNKVDKIHQQPESGLLDLHPTGGKINEGLTAS